VDIPSVLFYDIFEAEGKTMRAILRQFYQMSNTKLVMLNLGELEYGIDYEVISETIFDFKGNEYMSLEEVTDPIRADGDFIVHLDLLETNIAVSLNRQINFRKAKECNLGVIELLRGKHKGKQFLFPIYDMDLEVQLMAYEVLTTRKVFRPFAKVLKHPEHVKYIQLVLGVTVFEEFSQLLNIDTNVIGG
jgi:hypothetical protein